MRSPFYLDYDLDLARLLGDARWDLPDFPEALLLGLFVLLAATPPAGWFFSLSTVACVLLPNDCPTVMPKTSRRMSSIVTP